MSYSIGKRSMQEDYMVIHQNSYIERAKLNGYGSSKEKHSTLDDLGQNMGDMAKAFGQTDPVDVQQNPTSDNGQGNSQTNQDGTTNNNDLALDDVVYRLMQDPTASTKELHDTMELLTDQYNDVITTNTPENKQHAGLQKELQRRLDDFTKKSPTYNAFLDNLQENKENIDDQLAQAQAKLNPTNDDDHDKTQTHDHRKSALTSDDDKKKKARDKIDDSQLSDEDKQKLETKIQNLQGESADYQSLINNVNAELKRAEDLNSKMGILGKDPKNKLTADQDTNGNGQTSEVTGDQDTGKTTTDQQEHHIGGGKVRGPQDDIIDPFEAYRLAHPTLFGGTSATGDTKQTESGVDTKPDPLKDYLARRQQQEEQATQQQHSMTSMEAVENGLVSASDIQNGLSETDTQSLISQLLSGSGQAESGTTVSGILSGAGTTGSSTSAQIQSLLQQFNSI